MPRGSKNAEGSPEKQRSSTSRESGEHRSRAAVTYDLITPQVGACNVRLYSQANLLPPLVRHPLLPGYVSLRAYLSILCSRILLRRSTCAPAPPASLGLANAPKAPAPAAATGREAAPAARRGSSPPTDRGGAGRPHRHVMVASEAAAAPSRGRTRGGPCGGFGAARAISTEASGLPSGMFAGAASFRV